jgi:hypothetical protein
VAQFQGGGPDKVRQDAAHAHQCGCSLSASSSPLQPLKILIEPLLLLLLLLSSSSSFSVLVRGCAVSCCVSRRCYPAACRPRRYFQAFASTLTPTHCPGNDNARARLTGVCDDGGRGLVYVPDLGSDKVRQLQLSQGGKLLELEALSFSTVDGAGGAGGGPRHLALHPSLEVCYCLHELASVVSVVARRDARLQSIVQQGASLVYSR